MSKQELIDISHLITEEYYNVLVGRCAVVAQFEGGLNWISKKIRKLYCRSIWEEIILDFKKSENYIVAQFEGGLNWHKKNLKTNLDFIKIENDIGFHNKWK